MERSCHTQSPPQKLNKNNKLEEPTKRGAPARRLLLALVSSILLGVVVLGAPASVAAQMVTQACTRDSMPVPAGSDLANDCNTLLGIKNALNGTTGSLNWAANTDMDRWTQITVAGTPPRVTRLSPVSANLNGSLPATLANLTGLTYIHVGDNQLTGNIPNLSALTNLTHLYLRNNNFTSGSIPSWITNLGNLTTLDLRGTNRTGPIPNLSSLSNLTQISIGNNDFDSGEIPNWITGMTDLKTLYISNANLTGDFPNLSRLTKLESLNLSDNNFNSGYWLRFNPNTATRTEIPPLRAKCSQYPTLGRFRTGSSSW